MKIKITEEQYAEARNELIYHFLVTEFTPSPYEFFITSSVVRHDYKKRYGQEISAFIARKHFIKPWLDQKMIQKYNYGCVDDDGYVHCIKGYAFTIVAYRSELGIKAKEEADREWEFFVNETMKGESDDDKG